MIRNMIGKTLLKNRYLAVSCVLLIFGTILGIVALKSLPEELFQEINTIVTKSQNNFLNIFIDQFVFSEILLLMVFLSGFSLLGHLTNGLTILLFGMVYGIKNSAAYSAFGSDYVSFAFIKFFIFYIFYMFLFLMMAESSLQQSQKLFIATFSKSDDKPHYHAKIQTVKFICFTVFSALFSALYAYLSILIR